MDVDTFLATYGLLEAARFMLPLKGPAMASESDLMDMPALLLQASASGCSLSIRILSRPA